MRHASSAAIGAMNAEMKSVKWLWGGIGFQLAIGYTAAYLVYTVGTLLVSPASLHVGAALAGLAAVLLMAGAMAVLSLRAKARHKKVQA